MRMSLRNHGASSRNQSEMEDLMALFCFNRQCSGCFWPLQTNDNRIFLLAAFTNCIAIQNGGFVSCFTRSLDCVHFRDACRWLLQALLNQQHQLEVHIRGDSSLNHSFQSNQKHQGKFFSPLLAVTSKCKQPTHKHGKNNSLKKKGLASEPTPKNSVGLLC